MASCDSRHLSHKVENLVGGKRRGIGKDEGSFPEKVVSGMADEAGDQDPHEGIGFGESPGREKKTHKNRPGGEKVGFDVGGIGADDSVPGQSENAPFSEVKECLEKDRGPHDEAGGEGGMGVKVEDELLVAVGEDLIAREEEEKPDGRLGEGFVFEMAIGVVAVRRAVGGKGAQKTEEVGGRVEKGMVAVGQHAHGVDPVPPENL